MGKRPYKNIICLLLAAQMLCAPVAQAVEENPIKEAPLPQLTQNTTPPTQDDTSPPISEGVEGTIPEGLTEEHALTTVVIPPYDNARAGYGLSLHQDSGKRWFHLERADKADQDTVDKGTWLTLGEVGGVWNITDLPTIDAVGRLPDMRFAGWYAHSTAFGFNTKTAYYDAASAGKEIQLDTAISGETTGFPEDYYLNLVARWLPSDDARGLEVGFRAVTNHDGSFSTGTEALTLYGESVAGKTKAELDGMSPTAFDPENEKKEYYLRVGADVEAVDLSFLVQEPYAQFASDYESAGDQVPDVAACPVKITATTGDDTCSAGAVTDYTARVKYEILNGGTLVEGVQENWWEANNTTDTPAHSRWTAGDGGTRSYPSDGLGGYVIDDSIPLKPSAGSGRYYNNIKLTITAPDGVTTKTYTFHIQRLTDPTVVLNPGNTPLGMVARDTAGIWGVTEEQRATNKAAAVDYFKANKTFNFSGGHWPSDGINNNNGRIYHGNYFTMAWPILNGVQTNYDLDETAIVAYEDRKFQEPGMVLYGTEGDQVSFGNGAGASYENALERSYTLFLADKLTPDGVAVGAGTPGREETSTEAVSDPSGADVLNLESKWVRPGVYSIEYAYTDPVSGLTYDSEGAGFYRGNPEEFSRPLLVVPIPGDVDMDGAVTTADAIALRELTQSGVSGLLSQATADPGAALYLYRVCDVNRDGTIDMTDVEKLLSGYLPKVSNDTTNASDYFYLPLPMGEEPPRRSAPTGEEPVEPDKASLTLDYLGKNKPSVTDATQASDGPVQDPAMDKDSGLEVGDVFWVGVRLQDTDYAYSELYRRLLTSFTGTLTYDTRYVKPVTVLSEADRLALKNTGLLGNAKEEWKYTLRKYNVGQVSNTVWGTVNYDLTTGVDSSREYTAHYSKALPTLGGQGTANLREAVFSITAGTDGNTLNAEGGYLLLIPFQLINYPFGAKQGNFVELGMGMQDFVFTTKPVMAGRGTGLAGNELTIAWSMQDEIFGGATENAQEAMQYRGGSAVSLKLGEDTTTYQPLYNNNEKGRNAVYGEAFINTGVVSYTSEDYTELPPGLTKRGDTISGIPSRAGVYTFYVGGKPYQLTVEKAPLTVTAAGYAKYYAEEFYCGKGATDLIFTYDTSQIKPLDTQSGKPNTGTMADLAGLIGWDDVNTTYLAPACTAYAVGTTPVDRYTVVGSYPIKAEGGLTTNYEFQSVDGELTIKKRPIVVDELTVSSVGTVYHDGSIYLSNLPAQYAPPVEEIAVVGAPKLATDQPGQYNGLPLTHDVGVLEGDTLAIQYNVAYVRTEDDKQSGHTFDVPPGATVTREVTVSNIRLTETARWDNYELKSAEPTKQTATGNVRERTLSTIKVYSFPAANRAHQYGEGLKIAGSGLVVLLTSGEGQDAKEDYYTYSRDVYASLGLNMTWVTEEQMKAGEVGTESAYAAQYLHVKEHDGKYLCVWRQWEDPQNHETVIIKAYTPAPVTVAPRPLTLTVENQKQYYGEGPATPSFHYDVNELATWDKKTGLKGDMSELDKNGAVGLRDYVKPRMEVVTALTGGSDVGKKTPVTNTDCYITIADGQASDYAFRYVQSDGTETPVVSEQNGWGTLRIYPRPIVVQNVSGKSVGTIYADTYTTALTRQKFLHSADTDAANDSFGAAVPAGNYYTHFSVSLGDDPVPLSLPISGDAVVDGDIVTLTYDADFVRDNKNQKPPYFDLGDKGERTDNKVVVGNLALDSGNPISNCYELAFVTPFEAEQGYPHERYDKGNTEAATYGTIRRRPITGLQILAQPRLSYTYGEELTLYGMQVVVTYEDTYENDAAHNVKTETVKFNSNLDQNKLDRLGLTAWYSDGANLTDKVSLTGTYPTVKESTGKRLALSGQIPNAPADAVSPVTSGVTGPLTVAKKAITLTVQNKQFRFYGEPNGDYHFTAKRDDLAAPDRGLFAQSELTGSTTTHGMLAEVETTDLSKLPGYTTSETKLSFKTTAVPGSPVNGAAGYELTLVGGGTDNYSFRYVPGRIVVLQRPIQVLKVEKNPVYTIYPASDAEDAAGRPKIYSAQGTQVDVKTAEAGAAYKDYITVSETGSDDPLPMSGFGLSSGDKANFTFNVNFATFPTDANLDDDTRAPWSVTVSDVVLKGAAEGNYRLISSTPGDATATARVDKREIDFIEVVNTPVLDQYAYGDTLDLSDLKIQITYKKKDGQPGDQVESETVRYGERDNIYVNYRETAVLPDKVTQAIVDDHPANKNGNDHLTIAPVHGDPDFAANGKYLMVSARTHKNMDFVAPKLVGDKAIAVAPRQLTYTLSAEDKTYDGGIAATGTLKLTNTYNRGGIIDVVYIPTGAPYEDKGTTADHYDDFIDYVKTNGYTFTSGGTGLRFQFLFSNVRYEDESHSTAVPAELNSDYWKTEQPVKLPGQEGWGQYGPVASMPVAVQGMILAGPDAANYTWKSGDETQRIETTVSRMTRNEAVDGQAAAPYATIEKATYAMPDGERPIVAVDRHTNTAKLVMPRDLGEDELDSRNQYAAERHYEYALDTLLLGEGDGLSQQIEGGTLAHQLGEAEDYQDERFFGGEPVAVTIPEGYEPTEPPREPEEKDVVKGQVYLWADEDTGFVDEQGNALRTPLPRDAFLWGRVRLAETHNYLPSAPRYSIEDDSKLELDSAALLDGVEEAAKRAQAEVDMLIAEAGKRPEKEEQDPAPVFGTAGKSYAQRLDLISTEQKRGTDNQDYQIDTLESVWFTDVLQYSKRDVMDAVVRNAEPTRYYGYFWDQGHSAALEFDKEPLDLSGPIEGIEVEQKNENGTTEKVPITVNIGNIAKLYASITNQSGGEAVEKSISITPARLDVVLGSAPVKLTVEFNPRYTTIKTIKWTSSDETVARVSSAGEVTFVGVGYAVITATSRNKKTAEVAVRVEDPSTWIDPDAGIFDFYKTDAYSLLNEDGAFQPERAMTRGETIVMLSRFLKENAAWAESGSGVFPDVTGVEYYAEAAQTLGRLGVIQGIHGGDFAADSTITRAEFITILARMMNVPVPDTKGKEHAFQDSGEKDTWAYAYIDAMAALGVAKGTGGNSFSPERPVTRAEAAVFLSRVLRFQESGVDSAKVVPTDITQQNWAYDAVIRAVNDLSPVGNTEKK